MAFCRRLCASLLLPLLVAGNGGEEAVQGLIAQEQAQIPTFDTMAATAKEEGSQDAATDVATEDKVVQLAQPDSDGLPSLPNGEVRAPGMFSYHKELIPLDNMDLLTCALCAVGLLIAAGGGIGGGGILVPLFMIMLAFRPKHAIALSNLTIFGGSISNVAFNIQKRQANGRAMIDWDIIAIMEPSTIAGAVIGSFMSKYLPDFVLTVCLAIVLSLLSWRTIQKGVSMYSKENAEAKIAEDSNGTELEGFTTVPQTDVEGTEAADDQSVPEIPYDRVILLVVCFAGCVLLTILKGSGSGSIIGVHCGSTLFWILSVSTIPWVTFFGWYFRRLLLAEHETKIKTGHVFGEGEIQWDATTTITYPLICTLAGIFAGLFGVGGGIVKGPLMLEMGVNPSVAAATAATMIFFTTSAACVSFVIFGLLEPEYGISGFAMGLGCTAVGQAGINVWMKTAKRQSPPVISIGAVMALSTILVSVEAYMKFSEHSMEELLAPSSICAVDH